MVAVGPGFGISNAFAAQPKGASGIGARRELGTNRAVHRADLDLATSIGLGKGHRNRRVNIVAVTLEEGIRFHPHSHEQIPGLSARSSFRSFASDTHPLSIGHPLWHLDPKSFGRDQHS